MAKKVIDNHRIRQENTAENFAAIRHIALNLLNTDTSFKAGIKQKENVRVEIKTTYRKSLWARGFVI